MDSLQIYSRDQGIESRSSGIVFRENRYEPRNCSVASPRDELFGDEVPLNEPPIAILPPGSCLVIVIFFSSIRIKSCRFIPPSHLVSSINVFYRLSYTLMCSHGTVP